MVQVKYTATPTLGHVYNSLIKCIKPDVHLNDLVTALAQGLNDSHKIVSNCCWSWITLSEKLGGDPTADTYALSPIAKESNNEANAGTSAYEEISTLVTTSDRDCFPQISQLSVVILDGLMLLSLNRTK
ncbi:karyopherin Kap95 [Basidiobolus ranarum]|uniref:Karyopherin Kap95 n=1 Tax=Basidiobolus ranarum TaxID=34480 RepID=A0ABR2VPD9_9FUNG